MQTNRTLALQLLAIVAGMLMLAAASVPLYRLFCQVTGFGGTTRRGELLPPTRIVDRTITVTFDANVDPHLPWKFEPIEKNVKVKLGENKLVAFRATNESGATLKASATYNVTPFAAGPYFNKIQCFCFKQQQLGPHQSATLPVSFYVDPAILDDPQARDVTNITLSYTFFSYDSVNQSKF